jgi:hypothetical protein
MDNLTVKYPYEVVYRSLRLCVTVPVTSERMSIGFSLLSFFSCRSLINRPMQLKSSVLEGNRRFWSGA